jgi:hypothetical protein
VRPTQVKYFITSMIFLGDSLRTDIKIRITGFSDFVCRPEFYKENVSVTGSASILRGGRKTPTLLGPLERTNLNHWLALSKGSNSVGVSPPSPGEENRRRFRNILFSNF